MKCQFENISSLLLLKEKIVVITVGTWGSYVYSLIQTTLAKAILAVNSFRLGENTERFKKIYLQLVKYTISDGSSDKRCIYCILTKITLIEDEMNGRLKE